jgi:hypothetical protein
MKKSNGVSTSWLEGIDMIPTLDDVKNARRYRFPASNKMLFLMDFRAWKGIPNDRDFYLKRDLGDGTVELVARGYGIAGDYGKGPIYIKANQLEQGEGAT